MPISDRIPTPRRGSLRSAAQKLNCSPPKVIELINAGALRAYRIGRHWKISDEAITDCIQLLELETEESLAECPELHQ